MQERHIIIPIFVPHKGCPHDCIFCNQKKISGQMEEMTPGKVPEIIETHLHTIPPGVRAELAFYGGSFTAIDPSLQEEFLKTARPYILSGRISEIRISTRPDSIQEEILDRLWEYGVKTIELGVQSLDDEVLKASCRGHNASSVYEAAALIRAGGFRLGIQTMTGLPGDSREKCLETARKVIAISPEFVRIYPVLVIKGTGLEMIYQSGEYAPQTLEEAVSVCAELMDLYESGGIQVIRVGLQSSSNINEGPDSEVAAGPVHPAFRQLVESKRMLAQIEAAIRECGITTRGIPAEEGMSPDCIKRLLIRTGAGNISSVIGQKRSNIRYLKDKYTIADIRVIPDDTAGRGILLKCE